MSSLVHFLWLSTLSTVGNTQQSSPSEILQEAGSSPGVPGFQDGRQSNILMAAENLTVGNNTLRGGDGPKWAPVDRTRMQYRNCPLACADTMLGDTWCNTACAVPECGDDHGDCTGWCAPDCKQEWLGDKFCDRDCFREECEWDKGDCDQTMTRENTNASFLSYTMQAATWCFPHPMWIRSTTRSATAI